MCHCVPCLPHVSSPLPRQAFAIRSTVLRTYSHQSYPIDAEFHASLKPWVLVHADVLLAFPLTRLRRSIHLHHWPANLQHESLVDDQFSLHHVDLKFLCVHRLCRSTRPSGIHDMLPHQRIWTPSAITLWYHLLSSHAHPRSTEEQAIYKQIHHKRK
jgi:hypothetical protein